MEVVSLTVLHLFQIRTLLCDNMVSLHGLTSGSSVTFYNRRLSHIFELIKSSSIISEHQHHGGQGDHV